MGAVFLEMRRKLKEMVKTAKNVSKMWAVISSPKLHQKIPPGPSKIDQKLPKSGWKITKNRRHCQKNWLFSVKKGERRKTRKKNEKKAKKGSPGGGGRRLNLTSRENGKRLAIYSYNAAICHCLWKLILQLCHLLLSAALPFVAIVCYCLLLRAAAICCFAQLFAAVYFCSLWFLAFHPKLLFSSICCHAGSFFKNVLLLFVAFWCYLLQFDSACRLLLLFTAVCRSAAICCCLLLFAVVCCCSLLFVAVCCCLLLFVAVCRWSLLFVAVCR